MYTWVYMECCSAFAITLTNKNSPIWLVLNPSNYQWRRQGLKVGEAHLVGETNIFNVKYIIDE